MPRAAKPLSDATRVRHLEAENRRLRKALATAQMGLEAMADTGESAATIDPIDQPRQAFKLPAGITYGRPSTGTHGQRIQLIADARTARKEGFSREEVEAQLSEFGLSDDQIQQVLDAAGL